jgi:anti-anti-sigma factor
VLDTSTGSRDVMDADHVPPTPSTRLPHPVRLLRAGGAVGHRPRSRLLPRRRPTRNHLVFEQVGRPAAGGLTWLWSQSDLDLATVPSARRELSALLPPGYNPGTVLVYLGPERFVDLRGLRLLVDTARRVRSRGGALAVVAPPPSLRRLVQLSRSDTELPLIATARQAAWWARTGGTGLL